MEHPLINEGLLYELATLHAEGQTHPGAVAIIPFELSMPADRHDLGVLIRRGWTNWVDFVPFDERKECIAAAARADGGGLAPYGGAGICGRASGAFVVASIPVANMVASGKPMQLHEPSREFAFSLVGTGCCRLSRGTTELRASSLGLMFVSDCATACESDSTCAAFELAGLRGNCQLKSMRAIGHTCMSQCWLFFDAVGQPFKSECDQKSGQQICYAKELATPEGSVQDTSQSVRHKPAVGQADLPLVDALVIGEGQNVLELLQCLDGYNISAVAYKSEHVMSVQPLYNDATRGFVVTTTIALRATNLACRYCDNPGSQMQTQYRQAKLVVLAFNASTATNTPLTETMPFPNNQIDPRTGETSVRGIFDPMRDSLPIEKVCRSLLKRLRLSPQRVGFNERQRNLARTQRSSVRRSSQDMNSIVRRAKCLNTSASARRLGRRTKRLFVILSASVISFIDLSDARWRKGRTSFQQLVGPQQKSKAARLALYERVVAHWAQNTSTRVVFAENSGANLASLRKRVSPSRESTFEFLQVPTPPVEDIGSAEALTVLHALEHSHLLSEVRSTDLIFLVTGRYAFQHDLDATVRRSCASLPLVVLQNPAWQKKPSRRQETSILGFEKGMAQHLFGWASPAATRAESPLQRFAATSKAAKCMECHATRVRAQLERAAKPGCVCKLPSMRLAFPVQEGSTSIWRTSI